MLNEALPLRDQSQGDPKSFTSLDGDVRFHFDLEEFDMHMDVRVGADPSTVCSVYTQADWWGLEVLDDEESEAEILEENGIVWVRRYLTPKIPSMIPLPRSSSIDLTAGAVLAAFAITVTHLADVVHLLPGVVA